MTEETTTVINWLQVFDRDDLLLFLSELITEIKYYETDDYASPWDDLIKEWYKSSLAIQNEDSREAFNDVVDEVELTRPQ